MPPSNPRGVCVWLTGLSGSGKTSTAEALTALIIERGRQVSLFDGDVIRKHLSAELGFSKEHHDVNVRRVGFVASEIMRHGGVVVCALISPYEAVRDDVRRMVGDGKFVEVYVNTPLSVCEARDDKGMYGKARRGEIKGFTGIDDPYEPPAHPEIELDTVCRSVAENAARILDYLICRGFLAGIEKDSPLRHK